MRTLCIAIVSLALSVAVRFYLKASMSSLGIKEIFVQLQTLRSVFSITTGKFELRLLVAEQVAIPHFIGVSLACVGVFPVGVSW